MSKKLLEIHPDDIYAGCPTVDYAMPALGTPVSIEKPDRQSNPT